MGHMNQPPSGTTTENPRTRAEIVTTFKKKFLKVNWEI